MSKYPAIQSYAEYLVMSQKELHASNALTKANTDNEMLKQEIAGLIDLAARLTAANLALESGRVTACVKDLETFLKTRQGAIKAMVDDVDELGGVIAVARQAGLDEHP